MVQDINEYVKNCPHCQTTSGKYTDPKTKLGSIIANNQLDLLCINIMKLDPSKDYKGNILVLTNTFIKFTQAFMTPN